MALKKDVLTKAQKAELEQLRPLIVRMGLLPLMTGAAWRSALDAVMAIAGYSGLYRLRAVRDAVDPPENRWQGPLPHGLPLYNFIEWLELNPKPQGNRNYSAAIKQALAEAKISYSETASGIRIHGYRRSKI